MNAYWLNRAGCCLSKVKISYQRMKHKPLTSVLQKKRSVEEQQGGRNDSTASRTSEPVNWYFLAPGKEHQVLNSYLKAWIAQYSTLVERPQAF